MYVTTDRLIGDNGFQKTRSWRTGCLFPGEATRQVVPNPPRKTGRLGEDIRKRNEYYKGLAANLQSVPNYSGHSLVSDSGHEFETVKGFHKPVLSHVPGTTREMLSAPQMLVPSSIRSFIGDGTTFNPYASNFPWTRDSADMNNVMAVDQTRLASSISDMIPDHGEMGWGETLFELARGNIPQACADLIRRAKMGKILDPKGWGRDLGSDYLNAQFGLAPIASDFKALIEHMETVNGLLYNNFKRDRKTYSTHDVRTERSALDARVLDPGAPWSDYGYRGKRVDITHTLTTDTIIKAKFAKARPSRLADSYLDQAALNIRKLGFNEKLSWDLLPFSWLIDWYGNVGSSIENAAAFNPSSGRYLSQYMWATSRTIITASGGGAWSQLIHKKRRPISPFGLSSAVPTLNSYQWSILAALGFAYKTK